MTGDLYAIVHIDDMEKIVEEDEPENNVTIRGEVDTKKIIDDMEADGSITEYCFFKLVSVDPRNVSWHGMNRAGR